MTPDATRLGRKFMAVAMIAAGTAVALYAGHRAWTGAGPCGPSAETLARLRPLARGEVAAFEVSTIAAPAPALAMQADDGRRLTLGDFSGRTVLLNLWATWCAPCRVEMPALDRLQAELGGSRFEVVAVNIDTRNVDAPRTWLAAIGAVHLAYYSDKDAKIFQDLRTAKLAQGMPTTVLIDGRGCLLGAMAGAAEWASPDGKALVSAALTASGH